MTTGEQGRTGRWARFFRGWLAAAFATFIAALSHTLGGGGTPGLLAVVVSLAFAGIICISLTGPTSSLWRTSASVVGTQLVFHGLFALTGASGPGSATLVQQHPSGAHAHTLSLSVVETGSSMPVHTAGAGMWLAHALAAVVTVLALRFGEQALRTLFENARLVIRRLVPRLAAAVAPAAPRRSVNAAPVVTPSPCDVLISPLRHRGPPLAPGASRRAPLLLLLT